MKLTLHSAVEASNPALIATLTVVGGKVVCDPPEALDTVLRDGRLDLAGGSLGLEDGEAFLKAMAQYRFGGYVFATLTA